MDYLVKIVLSSDMKEDEPFKVIRVDHNGKKSFAFPTCPYDRADKKLAGDNEHTDGRETKVDKGNANYDYEVG